MSTYILPEDEMNEERQRAWSYSELAELDHDSQVGNFGFCMCEDLDENQEPPYDNCPVNTETEN